HAAGFRGTLRRLRIASRDQSGRVARLTLDGLQPDEISGQDLRVAIGRTLGWQHVKSTAFELKERDTAYRFTGHGSGHGVGMCVIGSAQLAVEGRTADAILAQYFPGLTLSPMAAGSVETHEDAPSAAQAPARTIPDSRPGAVSARPMGDRAPA